MSSTPNTRSSAYELLVDPEKDGLNQAEDRMKHQVILADTGAQVAVSRPGERYKSRAGLVTGILLTSIGVMLLIVDVIEMAMLGRGDTIFYQLLGMIFGSMLYIATGIVGIVSYKQRPCIIITYMVLSIISAICLAPQTVGNLAGAITIPHHCMYIYEGCPSRVLAIKMICNAIATVLSLIEFVVAIVGAAFCCHGVCRCGNTTTQTVVVMYDPSDPNPQIPSSEPTTKA